MLVAACLLSVPFSIAEDIPSDGVYRTYSRAGSLEKEEYYKNTQLDGESKDFYPTGALKMVTHYVKNQRQGKAKTYFENGGIESEGSTSWVKVLRPKELLREHRKRQLRPPRRTSLR